MDKIIHVKIGLTCNLIQTDMHVTIIDMHVTIIDNHRHAYHEYDEHASYMSACDTLQTDMHVTIIDMHNMVTMNMRVRVV